MGGTPYSGQPMGQSVPPGAPPTMPRPAGPGMDPRTQQMMAMRSNAMSAGAPPPMDPAMRQRAMMQMQANGSNPAMPPPGGGPMPPGVSRPMMDPASQMQMRQRMQQMMAMRGQGAGAPYPSTNLFSRQGGGISGLMPNAGPPAGYAAGGPVLWKPITEPAGGGGGINTLPAVTAVNPTVVAPPIVQPAVAAAPAVPAGQIALASTVPKMSILSDTARRYLGGPGADMADYVATNFNKMKNPTIADYLRARDDMQKYQGMAQGWFRYGGGSSHGGGGGGGGYGSSAGSSGGGHLA